MSTRTRISITLASALALGVSRYGDALSIATPGPGRDVWDASVPAAYALAVIGVFLVNRWWALLPAVVPALVSLYLYTLTDYSTPWESEAIGTPSQPVLYAFLVLIGIALQAAVLSIGFLPRRVRRAGRRLNRSAKTPEETPTN